MAARCGTLSWGLRTACLLASFPAPLALTSSIGVVSGCSSRLFVVWKTSSLTGTVELSSVFSTVTVVREAPSLRC